MCESATLERITQAVRGLPEPLAEKVLDYIEDLADIAEANARLASPRPAIPLEDNIREFDIAETREAGPEARESDFFALAGLWAGRDIDATALRRKAWPERPR